MYVLVICVYIILRLCHTDTYISMHTPTYISISGYKLTGANLHSIYCHIWMEL